MIPTFTVSRDPYRLVLELPGLPRMTNPSGAKSTHWRVVKAERDQWKGIVHSIAKAAGLPRAPCKTARLHLTRYSSVSPDPDGLVSGFKAIVDGLVEAGVLANDRFENIGMPTYDWQKVKPKQGRIRVVVEECEP